MSGQLKKLFDADVKIVNIAQGSFYLVGGYVGYIVVRYTGTFTWRFLQPA